MIKCYQFKRKSHDGHSKIQERPIRRKQQQHTRLVSNGKGKEMSSLNVVFLFNLQQILFIYISDVFIQSYLLNIYIIYVLCNVYHIYIEFISNFCSHLICVFSLSLPRSVSHGYSIVYIMAYTSRI